MLSWLNRKPVSVEIMTPVNDSCLETKVSELETRLFALEKIIKSHEDYAEQIEFELSEKIAALTEAMNNTRLDLINTTALCQKIETLAKSTASTTVSKSEFLDFVSTLAEAVKEARSRLDLPF
jgi:hypothetical protein